MPKVSEMVSAPQSRSHFLAPICTRPKTPDDAMPEAWQPPHGDDARPVIEGDVVREVRGYTIHCIRGVDYLSTGTVLKIMRWSDLSHVAPFALEYGRVRGSYVDRASRCHDAGCLDWGALDEKLKPYVDAWSLFKSKEAWRCTATEKLIVQPWARTFGYRDRVGQLGGTPIDALDIKTSDHIGSSYFLQLASYLAGPEGRAVIVQLTKTGDYHLHPLEQPKDWRRRFENLASEAMKYLHEEEQRAAAMAEKKRTTRP